MQPKIIFTGATIADTTNTGQSFVSITRNPDGSVNFETVATTNEQGFAPEEKKQEEVSQVKKD